MRILLSSERRLRCDVFVIRLSRGWPSIELPGLRLVRFAVVNLNDSGVRSVIFHLVVVVVDLLDFC